MNTSRGNLYKFLEVDCSNEAGQVPASNSKVLRSKLADVESKISSLRLKSEADYRAHQSQVSQSVRRDIRQVDMQHFWIESDKSFASDYDKQTSRSPFDKSNSLLHREKPKKTDFSQPEKSTMQLIDEMRLQKIYDRRNRQNRLVSTSTPSTELAITYGFRYSQFKNELDRIGTPASASPQSSGMMFASSTTFDLKLNSKSEDIDLQQVEGSLHSSLSPRSLAWKESIKRNIVPLCIREFFRESKRPESINILSDQLDVMRCLPGEYGDGEVSILSYNRNDDELESRFDEDFNEGAVISINLKGKLIGDDNGLCLGSALLACPSLTYLNISGIFKCALHGINLCIDALLI